jgi:DNA-binding transcriptional LysR family regulator
MDRFHQIQVFNAVAEEQGFAAAARRLRMSPPAVTRAITALEQRLGVKLLHRTTRTVRTTEAGQRYLEDSRRVLSDMDIADEAAAGVNVAPRGHLGITAPALFGRLFVLPCIVEYLEQYPDVSVEAVFLDRVVNMMDEGLDVGIRIGELADSSMRALKVGSIRLVTVAAPDYLARAGIPLAPDDLKQHATIASLAGNNAMGWRYRMPDGEHSLRLQPRLTCNTNDAVIEAASAGLGVTRVLSYQVANHLRDGSLQTVLEQFEPPPRPIHIVHREDRFSSSKVRVLIDLMAERLRAHPALN